jgi:acylphosphatase
MSSTISAAVAVAVAAFAVGAEPAKAEGPLGDWARSAWKSAVSWVKAGMAERKPEAALARTVFYTGRVQGVGFRATTVSISRSHRGVGGWVKNLPDGRVELFVEGRAGAVEAFLSEVRKTFERNITREEFRVETPTGKYKLLTVEYSGR